MINLNLVRLTAAISVTAVSLLPGLDNSAIAQEPDSLCYMTTQSGQVIDLSNSLCNSQKSKNPAAINSDQAFLQAYKSNLKAYPEVKDTLLANVQNSPEQTMRQAKNLCNDLRAGVSFSPINKSNPNEAAHRAGIANAEIISSLATKYYCPDID